MATLTDLGFLWFREFYLESSRVIQVIGLNNVPFAGDEFEVVGSLDVARERAESRVELLRDEHLSAKAGDGKGSIEAVKHALQVLPQENVTLKFLLQATGDVSASDVDLAVSTKAIILGFNVKVPGSVQSYADNKGVEIRLYKIIYEHIDEVRNAMEGLLEPVEDQVPIGTAEVRAIFSSGSGRVARCMVTKGKIVKGCGIRVVRNGKTVYTNVLDSLRRVKENVKEDEGDGDGLGCC